MKNKNIEEIKATIEELKAQVKKLEQKESEKTPKLDKFGRYMSAPKLRTKYWLISGLTYVQALIWDRPNVSRAWLLSGNAFNTEENANKELKRLELKQKAREFMHRDRIENDFEPDFAGGNLHHCIVLNNGDVQDVLYEVTHALLVFSSSKVREQFREEFSDDDIKMILGAL